jgi:uncharacterized protein (TIGR04255 family)
MSDIVFRKPPLVEVSFAIRFKPPAEFSSAHIGRFWAQIAKDFSLAVDKPPIMESGQITLVPDGLAPRVWLVHNDQALLLQIQRDRFYVNWRRLGAANENYPSFKKLQPLFSKYLGEWIGFTDTSGLGQLEIQHCELSYMNFIVPDASWSGLNDLGKVFVCLGASQDIGATHYSTGWNGIYDFGTNRVSAILQTLRNVSDPSQKKIQFEVKAEPLAPLKVADDPVAWLTSANEDIVNAFLSLTTTWAQKELWERVN